MLPIGSILLFYIEHMLIIYLISSLPGPTHKVVLGGWMRPNIVPSHVHSLRLLHNVSINIWQSLTPTSLLLVLESIGLIQFCEWTHRSLLLNYFLSKLLLDILGGSSRSECGLPSISTLLIRRFDCKLFLFLLTNDHRIRTRILSFTGSNGIFIFMTLIGIILGHHHLIWISAHHNIWVLLMVGVAIEFLFIINLNRPSSIEKLRIIKPPHSFGLIESILCICLFELVYSYFDWHLLLLVREEGVVSFLGIIY